ncbi:MAG: hypothetical protein HYR66_14510 [Sphingobacteriales bacterium]|nr:hypothetical protein [Sphingobacteriales bacterium]MBI3719309.1 hypothetical protein [Sphingobacteriales bacterium]
MNQSFSINRWGLLMGKHWSENRKKYTLGVAAIASLMLLWYGFMIIVGEGLSEDIQGPTYFVGLFIIGCIYASLLFGDLADKPKGISYLSVPASHLEKVLCNLFFGVIVFFFVYLAIYYIVTPPMLALSNAVKEARWKTDGGSYPFIKSHLVNVFHFGRGNGEDVFYLFHLGFFAVQATFILGSVYFTRFSFIKTVISVLLIWLFLFLFLAKVLGPMMPDGSYFNGLTNWSLMSDGNAPNKVIMLPKWIESTTTFLFKFGFAPLFWVVTYFRLKEKEI